LPLRGPVRLAAAVSAYQPGSTTQFLKIENHEPASRPTYLVAPPDSVHALGVVSINFARFEMTNNGMLAAVANIGEQDATAKAAKLVPGERIKLIRSAMARREWPDDVAAATTRYLTAMEILTKNRNVLIHSNMAEVGDSKTAIFSMSRDARRRNFVTTPEDIRGVADELNDYFWFGHALSNYIASEIHYAARDEGMMAISHLPELLPLPVHIDPAERPA
jgi:hypothetical protein